MLQGLRSVALSPYSQNRDSTVAYCSTVDSAGVLCDKVPDDDCTGLGRLAAGLQSGAACTRRLKATASKSKALSHLLLERRATSVLDESLERPKSSWEPRLCPDYCGAMFMQQEVGCPCLLFLRKLKDEVASKLAICQTKAVENLTFVSSSLRTFQNTGLFSRPLPLPLPLSLSLSRLEIRYVQNRSK